MSAATLDPWMAARMGLAAPLTRAAIDAWQLARLNETIAHARAASPFYRARRDWQDGPLASLEDLARLPFTTAADLLANDPPLLALSQSAVARVVTLETSGTSGPPKRLHFTPDDLESTVDFFRHGMGLFTRPGDRVGDRFPGRHPGGDRRRPRGRAAPTRRRTRSLRRRCDPVRAGRLAAQTSDPTSSPGRRFRCSPRRASPAPTAARRSARALCC